MTIFFTSDHHFSHKNIIQLCNRPFNSVEEMDEEMIRRWNSVVAEEDFVYYLGDFSLSIKPVEKYVHRLNGTKILIPGNHDKCHFLNHKTCTSLLFSELRYVTAGFKKIFDYEQDAFTIQTENTVRWIGRYDILLSHFPYDNGDDKRFYEIFQRDEGQWLLHGHVHNRWKVKDKQINIGVDQWDFYPVSLDKILEIIKGEDNET